MTKSNYLTPAAEMPPFMMFPNFLIREEISDSAKILYAELLSRTRVSMKHARWCDTEGNVFSVYPQHELAAYLRKARSTIELLLAELVNADLIECRKPGRGRANWIYVKIPPYAFVAPTEASDADYNADGTKKSEQSESHPPDNGIDRHAVNTKESVNTSGHKSTDVSSLIDRTSRRLLTDTSVTNNKNNNIKNKNYINKGMYGKGKDGYDRKPDAWELKEGIKRGKDLDAILNARIIEQIEDRNSKCLTKVQRQASFEETLRHLRGEDREGSAV